MHSLAYALPRPIGVMATLRFVMTSLFVRAMLLLRMVFLATQKAVAQSMTDLAGNWTEPPSLLTSHRCNYTFSWTTGPAAICALKWRNLNVSKLIHCIVCFTGDIIAVLLHWIFKKVHFMPALSKYHHFSILGHTPLYFLLNPGRQVILCIGHVCPMSKRMLCTFVLPRVAHFHWRPD